MVTPRLHRWSSKLTISATQCSKLQVKLSKPDNVRRDFVYISVEEQDLLGGEGEADSTDFEEEENRRYFKRCGKISHRLVDHITHDSFRVVDAIMIPCNVASHWVLLVGNLKGRYWDFYDSLPNPMYRTSLHENIRFLQEDRSEVLPGDIIDWLIHVIEGLPTQDNDND
ncbi:hypothetical protein KSP40_PGU011160 [Platanthera guangdongensis]|uniref:Ubiquitin-like protease family profile domain-containing protein n=1 Tax=Platanthera guangdongensis TaxID=2320717 RepID=A0ABR2M335_9ASPA